MTERSHYIKLRCEPITEALNSTKIRDRGAEVNTKLEPIPSLLNWDLLPFKGDRFPNPGCIWN